MRQPHRVQHQSGGVIARVVGAVPEEHSCTAEPARTAIYQLEHGDRPRARTRAHPAAPPVG